MTQTAPRWRFRFSFRTLLLLMLLIGVFLGGWMLRDSRWANWFRPYRLERQFSVSARNNQSRPLQTGIYLQRGDVITFHPKKSDRWSAHGANGPFADYSGSPGYPQRLRLHYRIGNETGVVSDGTPMKVKSNGRLRFFCEDDDISDNHGAINVRISLASSSKPNVEAATDDKKNTKKTQPSGVTPPGSQWFVE